MNIATKAAMALTVAGLAAGASAGAAVADTAADGTAANSSGLGSGNLVQAPVHVPTNATGNTLNVVGLLNPAFDNSATTG